MGESRHTPGPWTAADRVVVTTIEANGYATWIANCAVGGCSDDKQKANARLISAAPDLLKACVFLSDQLDELINRHYGGELPCSDEEIAGFEAATAAIAAATGEQG